MFNHAFQDDMGRKYSFCNIEDYLTNNDENDIFLPNQYDHTFPKTSISIKVIANKDKIPELNLLFFLMFNNRDVLDTEKSTFAFYDYSFEKSLIKTELKETLLGIPCGRAWFLVHAKRGKAKSQEELLSYCVPTPGGSSAEVTFFKNKLKAICRSFIPLTKKTNGKKAVVLLEFNK